MKIDRVWLDALNIGPRHRQVQEDKVAALAESMEAIGLQQPISVWFDSDEAMHLVAGLHRVRAAQKLGWEQVPAVAVDMTETERELWEISENLHRVDLTKEERDEHIRRYAELLEEQKRISRQDVAKTDEPRERGRPEGVAKQISNETGLSQRTIQRALQPKDPKPVVVEVKDESELDHEQFEAAVRYVERLRPGAKELLREYLT